MLWQGLKCHLETCLVCFLCFRSIWSFFFPLGDEREILPVIYGSMEMIWVIIEAPNSGY